MANSRLVCKDICSIVGRAEKDIIVVEDYLGGVFHKLENVVPILPFRKEREDSELLKLKELLKYLHDLEDHCKFIQAHFKLSEVALCESPQQAANLFL